MILADVLTILAILTGPAIGVWLTRLDFDRRDRKSRRLNVFRSLMSTRRTFLSPDHVKALNLVEIEFHGEAKVLEAYRDLFKFFEHGISRNPGENDGEHGRRRIEVHSNLLSKLLAEMSSSLGYRHDQFSLLRGGYSPELHGQIEMEQSIIRQFATDLALGKKVVPVAVVDYTSVASTQQPVLDGSERKLTGSADNE